MFDLCVCVFHSTVCVHIPQKDFKTRKKEKHATKIPSSRGLFIEDSSCFFVSGPRVKKKRGEKEKRENSKKITGKNGKKRISKKEKKKEQKGQISKSSWLLIVLFFFPLKRVQKQKQKASQTQIYHKKRHKIKENCFWTWFPSLPLQRKRLPLFMVPLSLSPLNPVCSLSLTSVFLFLFFSGAGWLVVGVGKKGMWSIKASVIWRTGPSPFLPPYDQEKRQIEKKRTSKEEDTYRKNGGFGSWWSNPPQILTPTFQQQKHIEHFKGRSHNISQLDPF